MKKKDKKTILHNHLVKYESIITSLGLKGRIEFEEDLLSAMDEYKNNGDEVSESEAINLIDKIDTYARDVADHYGLPQHNEHMDKLIEIIKSELSIKKQNKPLLGLAKTSELIYELSARCDTGSIDKGGNYRTVDGD